MWDRGHSEPLMPSAWRRWQALKNVRDADSDQWLSYLWEISIMVREREGEEKKGQENEVCCEPFIFFGGTEPLLCSHHHSWSPFSLSKQTPELISAQHRVMERGLSLFCQAFDGVIDWARGIRDEERGLQKKGKNRRGEAGIMSRCSGHFKKCYLKKNNDL